MVDVIKRRCNLMILSWRSIESEVEWCVSFARPGLANRICLSEFGETLICVSCCIMLTVRCSLLLLKQMGLDAVKVLVLLVKLIRMSVVAVVC